MTPDQSDDVERKTLDNGVLPMFPLGSVLFPGMLLPLQVFEPRYREMIGHCIEHEMGFGVTLIERGSEVGGGDVRTSIGCAAAILHSVAHPTGEWTVVCMGTERIVIDEWLEDNPYPRAVASARPDPPSNAADAEHVRDVERQLRTLLALAVEVGAWTVPLDTELSDDPVLASYQLGALSPIGAFDRHRLLSAPDVSSRLALLGELLNEQDELLRSGLG